MRARIAYRFRVPADDLRVISITVDTLCNLLAQLRESLRFSRSEGGAIRRFAIGHIRFIVVTTSGDAERDRDNDYCSFT